MNAKKLDLIERLLAKAESTTPEEAEALTEAAEKLMVRYGIDQALIDAKRAADAEPEKIIKRHFDFAGVHSLGLMHLTATVMRAFGTMNAYRVLLKGNRERVVVVGFESDVEQFAVLANSLHLQAIVAMRAWWKAMPFWEKDMLTQHEGNMAKRQFLVSFGQGAATRIKKATEEIVAQEGTGTELALLDRKARVDEQMPQTVKSARRHRGSALGREEGFAAGRAANTGDRALRGAAPALAR